MVREAQNIDLYRDWRTTSAILADHQWSAEQTLGITGLEYRAVVPKPFQFAAHLEKFGGQRSTIY